MAYENISDSEIEVGKPTKEEIFRKIKGNLDHLKSVIDNVSGGSGKVEIFNLDVYGGVPSGSLTGLLYHEIIQDCRITNVQIQIFEKGIITTGNLQIDIKKNTTPDNVGMNSILDILPTVDFATATDYQKANGTLNSTNQNVVIGDILRLDITQIPANLGKFRILVFAEL